MLFVIFLLECVFHTLVKKDNDRNMKDTTNDIESNKVYGITLESEVGPLL